MFQQAKNIYHLYTSVLANAWLRFPSRKLTVIGVTGTDGKTTTVNLIYHILKCSGLHASMVSTVGAIINDNVYDIGFHVTTPRAFHIQSFMKQALHGNIKTQKYMILEVTSHALDQNRVWGIPFAIGVLTNITHEHLDYHKTYEKYVNTKLKLLKRSKIAVINRDDGSYPLIELKLSNQGSTIKKKRKGIVTYGLGLNSNVNPSVFTFSSNLLGVYNKYNILAAIAVCKQLGLSDKQIKDAIKSFKPPIGRGEIVYDKDFTIMIDFAHTPNAFAQILPSVKTMTKGRLIHVFGSAGRRDASKRPLMGKISSRFADVIILTSEDSRDEDQYKIMREIEKGIQKSKFKNQNSNDKEFAQNTLFEIPDRKKAIEMAIKLARNGDFVLLTGKSHEKSINYGKGEEPWDEYITVSDALKAGRK